MGLGSDGGGGGWGEEIYKKKMHPFGHNPGILGGRLGGGGGVWVQHLIKKMDPFWSKVL